MSITFNLILQEAKLAFAEVRLLRHQDNRAKRGRTPYELWRDNRAAFDLYQSHQSLTNRARLAGANYWASFVGTPDDATLFVGLYAARYRGLLELDMLMPHTGEVELAGSCDAYDLSLQDDLSDLSGKLVVDWGPGMRAWIQRADQQNKSVIELRREFKEPEFPGFLEFMRPLSKIKTLPSRWVAVLEASRGVYLLTCPKTREQYVGSATGEKGFLQRWLEYAETGHGGDVALKSRDPSDYQVSVLEVAGTNANDDDILRMESRWKLKLQSREMGLNRN